MDKTVNKVLLEDVIKGLSSSPKHLLSRYFYDEKGSKIFQEIMQMEEYYLPECEIEILKEKSREIADTIPFDEFDVIELGAGDGTKTVLLLEQLLASGKSITYYPLDISPDILIENEEHVHSKLPKLKVKPIAGDYFETLKTIKLNGHPRLILFLGSNIGNFKWENAMNFIRFVNEHLQKGDFFLLGADLKKNPHTIRAAYNDKQGITKRFNINLLERINRELGGNFDLSKFEHFGTYNPLEGGAQSFLISLEEQEVRIADQTISFEKYEPIHMEISQKYSLKDLDQIGNNTGFSWDKHFTDRKEYFSLSLFRK